MIHWLSLIEDDAILDRIIEVKETSSRDWWDEISESERDSVLKGLKEADAGRLNSHSQARSLYEDALGSSGPITRLRS